MDRTDFAGLSALVKELFGSFEGVFLNPPFCCGCGSHIHVGKNFFANCNPGIQPPRKNEEARTQNTGLETGRIIQYNNLGIVSGLTKMKSGMMENHSEKESIDENREKSHCHASCRPDGRRT